MSRHRQTLTESLPETEAEAALGRIITQNEYARRILLRKSYSVDQGGSQDHCVSAGQTNLDLACKILLFQPDDFFF